ncbi:SusC/RagA family TonB-linked outer membrane protein [Pedobacter hartonius]|uniref:TonB-linked outer membrane protein, SusC/RagA family n=1 Tax=Pedobacter hartonius TaxID=425514 RepID=A0A1H3WGM6_9SPHI|nr:SusC/RagA family TonB-linked outer membrane protein [Pedobacter hartonius]SDZ86297.1 TonB-linked outer membrane protein, SusC/RagA family [Pedobacter hartonius]
MKFLSRLQRAVPKNAPAKSMAIIKVTFGLMLIFNLSAVAGVYSQKRISLKLTSAEFTDVLAQIEAKSDYRFMFSNRKIPAGKTINIDVTDKDVPYILTETLKNTGFTFNVLANNLIVIVPVAEKAADIIVKGKITDETGLPVIGASVQIKGGKGGATTNGDGMFSLSVPDNAVLVVSYIGYTPQEVSVNGRTTINVSIKPSANDLNEVVVTALGITKDQKTLGYSVTKVGGETMDKARESNIANSLSGRVAGLSVGGSTGGPGSSVRLNIRGTTSFTGSNSPLIVIDGVPIDNSQRGTGAGQYGGSDGGDGFSNINPDDVESMTVLKGSTASALYGARAANGVINITTKTGKKGRVQIEYNANLQFDKAVDNSDYQYEYGQGQHNTRPTSQNSAIGSGLYSWGQKLDGAPTYAADGVLHPYSAVTDNVSTFYRTAPSLTNSISVAGGGEKGTYRFSAANLDAKSVLPNSGLVRKTFNFSTNQQLTDKLSFNLVANYIDQQDKNKSYLSDSPLNANYALQFLPTSLDVTSLAPGYNAATGAEMSWNDNAYVTNPYFVTSQLVNNNARKRFISVVSAKYAFTSYLSLQARLGYDLTNDRTLSVTPTGTAFSNGGLGQLNSLAQSQRTELNTDALLNFNKDVLKDFNVNASVGANYRKATYESTGSSGNSFIIPYLYTASNTKTKNVVYDYNARETPSAYYTADFSYKGLITLSTTGRYDQFSTLPVNQNSIFTPSVSTSFVFSQLTKWEPLSFGKLRASYAKTSGEPASPYLTQQYYTIGNAINGTTTAGFSTALPNANLKPFSLSEFEVGTELKFLKNRIGIDASFFTRKTEGEVVQATTSVSSGYESRYVNLGSTKNTGIELQVSGTPIKSNDFNWNSSINFTHVKTEVLNIDGGANAPLNTGTYRPGDAYIGVVKGYAVAQILAYDYQYDANGNKVIGTNGIPLRGDLKPQGSGLPNIYGGWNNDFQYKNWNLSFLIDYRFGNKILSATEFYSYTYGLNKATLPGRDGGVIADGVQADGSKNTVNVDAQNYYTGLMTNVNKLAVLDGSFIKFRQATLGYTFKQNMLGKLPFSSISVNLVARNLFTIMKHTDNIDPENTFSSLVTLAGVEGGALPYTRTYGFNVNFKFK